MSGALKDAIRVERPAKTLRELALDKVREAIVNGYFRPGDRLVERDLCAQLGVSR
ncbi:GntR family transcriptional regulator, partial [Rhizobium ruizarguesonis]